MPRGAQAQGLTRMLEERRILAGMAVLLFAYAMVGMLALAARSKPLAPTLRRLWRRLFTRVDK
jgi:hypothetical protein